MSLPILKVVSTPTPATLMRYFVQTQANWSAHLAENSLLEVGTAWVNPQLNHVQMANRMMDVQLLAGMSPQGAVELVESHYAEEGSACLQWVMNPSAPAEQNQPMIDHLLSTGYTTRVTQIMYLDRMPASLPGSANQSLQIIPARASFKHVQALHEEAVRYLDEPQFVEARMLHLDDPHYDALLALKAGVPVALAGVLAMGEVGLVTQVFVSEQFRREGIASTMMGRVMEICIRSQFKHVLLDVLKGDDHAMRLYEKFGFRPLAEFVVYQRSAA